MRKVTLGEVCSRGSSNIAQKDLNGNYGKYPIYGASGLIKCVDFYHQEKEYVAVVKDGAGIGRTMLLPANSSVIGTMQYLIPNEDVDVRYLYYAIVNMNLSKYFSGATIPHIYYRDYQNEEFILPSMSEQIEKADILGKIEHLIAVKQIELTKLDDLVKSRFVEMFGDPIENPRGWSYETMKSICKKITDGEHGSVAREEKGHPFLNARHIKISGDIDWDSVTYTSDEVHERLYKRCNPEADDIVMTTTGTIGNVAVVPEDSEPFTMDRGITLLKLDKNKVKTLYIAWLLRQEAIQSIMKANIHASAIGHLFLNKVEQIPVMMPDMGLQDEFSSFVAQTDKSKLAVQKELEKLELLKKSLMQQYFG